MTETHPGVVHHQDLFHTGTVVDDLAAAKEELGSALGVGWHEGGAEVWLTDATGERIVRTAYVLSIEGPHHVELVQSIPDTLWSAPAPGHAHHLGYWVDDVTTAAAELIQLGLDQVASVSHKRGGRPMCTYHRSPNGLYLEIVSRALRPVLLPTT